MYTYLEILYIHMYIYTYIYIFTHTDMHIYEMKNLVAMIYLQTHSLSIIRKIMDATKLG